MIEKKLRTKNPGEIETGRDCWTRGAIVMCQMYGPSLDLKAQYVRRRRWALANQPDARASLSQRIIDRLPKALI